MTVTALETCEVAMPQDGPIAWTTHADLAAGAAVILTQEGRFEGQTPPLTASKAQDFTEIAAILGEISGRSIVRKTLTDPEFRQALAARRLPAAVADITLSMFHAARAGEFSGTDPALGKLLGREPTSLPMFFRHAVRAAHGI